MPGRNATGPMAAGPMTGRGMGNCNTQAIDTEENFAQSPGMGMGQGMRRGQCGGTMQGNGRGMCRGAGAGRGMGRGAGAGRGMGRGRGMGGVFQAPEPPAEAPERGQD